MTKKNNEKMNIHEIMAMFIAYMKQEMEYTGMRIKAMKEWEIDDCQCIDCEARTATMSKEEDPSFGDEFSKEWL